MNVMSEVKEGRNATIEALAGKNRELNFGHIEPTCLLGCVVHFKSLHEFIGILWFKSLVKGSRCMSIEIVLDEYNLATLWTMSGHQSGHKLSIIERSTLFSELNKGQTRMGLYRQQNRTDAMTLILIILAFGLTWFEGKGTNVSPIS
ncbi:MAG: hypothetical protein R2867_40865 [Caldilineaceae bacterium]